MNVPVASTDSTAARRRSRSGARGVVGSKSGTAIRAATLHFATRARRDLHPGVRHGAARDVRDQRSGRPRAVGGFLPNAPEVACLPIPSEATVLVGGLHVDPSPDNVVGGG